MYENLRAVLALNTDGKGANPYYLIMQEDGSAVVCEILVLLGPPVRLEKDIAKHFVSSSQYFPLSQLLLPTLTEK
jgi:hypothetical protein